MNLYCAAMFWAISHVSMVLCSWTKPQSPSRLLPQIRISLGVFHIGTLNRFHARACLPPCDALIWLALRPKHSTTLVNLLRFFGRLLWAAESRVDGKHELLLLPLVD